MLRLGLVGCGRLAERGYVPAAELADGVRLAAVADPMAERCERVAPGLPRFASAAELLNAHAADLVVLATPARVQVEDARRASEAAAPTLVEKPPARNAEEAELLAALEPPPWIGFNRRFDDGIVRLRDELQRAARFELRLAMTVRGGSWDPYEVRDPVLLDLGPHLVDLALWLSPRTPERVAANLEEKKASIEIAFPQGTATIGCAIGLRHREYFEVRANGRRMRHKAGGLRRKNPLVASLARQLDAFARAARGCDEPTLATARDGVAVMRVIEAARGA